MSIDDVLSGDEKWHVAHRDCLAMLTELPERSVGHVVTDPPYDEHTHKNVRSTWCNGTTRVRKIDLGFGHLTSYDFVKELIRVSRGWVLCFCALEQLGDYKRTAPGDWVRSGIFRKCQSAPQLSGDRPANSCEGLAIFHRPGKKKWNGHGTHAFWEHPRDRVDRLHPCQKPIGLMMELLELFTNVDDIVLDPFAGSGTTGVACLRLGRRYIGCELDEKYHEIACERLEAESSGLTLQAARAGQTTIFDLGGGK